MWAKALVPGSMDLPSLEVGRLQLFDLVPSSPGSQPPWEDLAMVETLAGYPFRKKGLLVEALTHGSVFSAHEYGCYDRLAFLGNAIIESLVSDTIYQISQQGQSSNCGLAPMSLYRAAVVNRHYLGYLALSWHLSQTRTAVQESSNGGGGFTLKRYDADFALWRFLRHSSAEMTAEMCATEARFATLRSDIGRAVESGETYPWLLLGRLRPNEFYADVIESLVGAVFIDSGSMETCGRMLDKMGLLPYLRRMLRDKVDVVHPKEHLQTVAGGKAVRYEVNKEQRWKCAVFVDECLVAEVEDGVAEEQLYLEAAVKATATLSTRAM